ncbi:MAG: response regulator [Deltaproteobacteria bacterium]|mgnify:CR=1 FL=1|jgi:response regulator RpfG family c-di-GMP phosphodiesterase|nr:response regulator [Deltaproteobacteria bacterium]MBT6433046.1 response regulator [Deltaproteobacteria bacterium]MBT6491483.1 response regulator [Deltaproteobacteria bacterium]
MKIEISSEKLAAAQDAKVKASTEKRAKILVVDDEEGNLVSLKNLLETHYEVFVEISPEAALEVFEANEIDLILSDQRMPEMLGTELLEKIKERSDDNVRIIITGYTDARDLITCINKDLIYKYVMKPWAPGDITTIVSEALSHLEDKRKLDKLISWARDKKDE